MPETVLICVGMLLVIVLWRGAIKGRPPLQRDDLQRMRRLADKIHREEVLPFE